MHRTSSYSSRPVANAIILVAWCLGFRLLVETGIGWFSGAHYDDLKVIAVIALLAPLTYSGLVIWMLAKFEFYMLSIVISMVTLTFFILLAVTIVPSY